MVRYCSKIRVVRFAAVIVSIVYVAIMVRKVVTIWKVMV
jgi:hypothetical protein